MYKRQVQGRWLAQLEDGTLLRVGENEVLSFSLYTGKELLEEELQAITQAARKSGLKEKALNLAASKPISRRELERKLESWEAVSYTHLDVFKRQAARCAAAAA